MVRLVKVAATQLAISRDPAANLELFENVYFCQEQKPEYFDWAKPLEKSEPVQRMAKLAKELKVVLPVSFFEKVNNAHFNSLAMIDADGSILGVYRKSHIPDGPGYQEKFYFTPGDTGFKVFDTAYGRLGAAICWDQWFPETARAMALQGAEILFYPTAIGSEPQDSGIDSYPHWTRTMLGHAAANLTPVVASNRVGKEEFEKSSITFYGGSFISGQRGEVLQQVGGDKDFLQHGNLTPDPSKEEGFVVQEFDLDELRATRLGWGVFRDRRPDIYKPLVTFDGSLVHHALK
ncbi:hypothetical protein MNEG_6133 [Monoraphidium neglectum]|uniref:CN hydrolase domain-containing protein n=1 Tax=Monoraphidium neglectum TaxID=145388 RepID=A0A0D2JS44_9CHLO|nr:hypothetical protein MNEG_6133 [Monoraphidium neglectum]KIZ01828.1 hypothetical protein MNEG_6133 [Monoraphidium neglectum]|eukprot:XP_013900847.1 hypothetical protein MNEG_6133 [Monoraphidium neglectum]